MTDLRSRFHSLDRVRPPELWDEIERRDDAAGGVARAGVTFGPRLRSSSSPRSRLVAFGLSATVVAGALVVARGIGVWRSSDTGHSAGGRPSATASPGSSGAPGLPGWFAFASQRDGDYDIYAAFPDGTGLLAITDAPGDDVMPLWSNDGTRIAFASNRDGDFDLFLVNPDGSSEVQVADLPGDQIPGGWSSDGQRLSYTSSVDGTTSVWVIHVDGSAPTEVVASGTGGIQFVSGGPWLGNDEELVVSIDKSFSGGQIDIYRVGVADGRLTQLTTEPGDDGSPAVSPDRSMIAFQSDRGDGCVFVMNADGSAVREVSTGCDTGFPISWSPDGAWIAWAGSHQRGRPSADIRVVGIVDRSPMRLTESRDIVDVSWGPARAP